MPRAGLAWVELVGLAWVGLAWVGLVFCRRGGRVVGMTSIETRGSVLLGGAVALMGAGLLKVDGVLLAIGAAAALLLGAVWWVGVMNLRGLGVALEVPRVARAGVAAVARVSVVNRKRVSDGFGVDLEALLPGAMAVACHVPWVPAGSAADAELREVPAGRGDGKVVECRVWSKFPLGMLRFERRVEAAAPMRVLPRSMVPMELLAAGDALNTRPRRSVVPGDTSGEPRGLRPYRAGDAARAIVWPATLRSRARGGGILVRELDPPGFHPRRGVVVFHSFGTDGALIQPDRFERAISLLWGTLGYFQSRGLAVVLMADFDEWVPRRISNRSELGEAGERLAGVKRASGTEAHEVQGRLAGLGEEDGLVILSDMPASSWAPMLELPRRHVVVDVARYETQRSRTTMRRNHG